jgi:hypothetical protein
VTERLDETPILAAAGYQYVNPRFSREAQYDAQWARKFKRLSQKQAFPIDRESYFYRPLDLLGICIGAQTCPAVSDAERHGLRQLWKRVLPNSASIPVRIISELLPQVTSE